MPDLLIEIRVRPNASRNKVGGTAGDPPRLVVAVQAPAVDGKANAAVIKELAAAFGLRNMASWEKGLSEMARVLRPGGHLLILDFSLPELPVIRPLYRFYLHHILPHIAGLATGRKDAYEYLGESIEQFPSGEKMTSLIESCGFKNAKSHPLTLGTVSIYTAIRN